MNRLLSTLTLPAVATYISYAWPSPYRKNWLLLSRQRKISSLTQLHGLFGAFVRLFASSNHNMVIEVVVD